MRSRRLALLQCKLGAGPRFANTPVEVHMKIFTSIATLLLLAAPAAAQAPPPTWPSLDRTGHVYIGASIGAGMMNADSGPISCANCDYQPAAVGGSAHIGGFLNPRLALMLELQVNGQVVDDRIEGNITLAQGAAMAAAQYWVTPRVWLKGGLGLSRLAFSYNDSYGSASDPIDQGGALLLACGIELLQAYNYAVDLQGRLLIGTYDGIGDRISAGTISVGFNWF